MSSLKILELLRDAHHEFHEKIPLLGYKGTKITCGQITRDAGTNPTFLKYPSTLFLKAETFPDSFLTDFQQRKLDRSLDYQRRFKENGPPPFWTPGLDGMNILAKRAQTYLTP